MSLSNLDSVLNQNSTDRTCKTYLTTWEPMTDSMPQTPAEGISSVATVDTTTILKRIAKLENDISELRLENKNPNLLIQSLREDMQNANFFPPNEVRGDEYGKVDGIEDDESLTGHHGDSASPTHVSYDEYEDEADDMSISTTRPQTQYAANDPPAWEDEYGYYGPHPGWDEDSISGHKTN